ncbi:MAG: DDE-type integrase/transposase/recombinase [Candidatus Bathyarchaeia archaeon]
MPINMREVRGKAIAALSNQIVRLDNEEFKVASQSGNGFYRVVSSQNGWVCGCSDHVHRKTMCKHIWAVKFSLAIRKEVQASVIQPLTDIHSCIYCHSSTDLIRFGLRHNKYGDLQKFSCKACGKFFTVNIGFERMKHNPQGITTAMQLYFSGASLRKTAKALELLGVQVSHKTVLMWIRKYVRLMEKYLEKITPQVGDTWRADEMYLKMKGDLKYLFALMDDETRFWIAQEVASTKDRHDAGNLFRKGRELAGKRPIMLVTDGLPAYRDAFQKEFYTHKLDSRTIHISSIRLQGDRNNNKMERLNNEIRDREKVMRSLKTVETPIISGYQIFHNYIRPHMALNGQTPSERAGIMVKGKDKWLTLIQNASRK